MGSSDHELYQLFKVEPRFLEIFIKMNPNQTYTFESLTFKQLQRQCDGILRCDDPNETTFIFEFQMQKKANIYERIMTEIVMFLNENPGQKVHGIIVFQDPSTDPGDENWTQVAETCPGLLSVLYLNQIYEDLKRTQPDSPIQAIFAPFVEKDPVLIRQNAPKWFKQLTQLPYSKEQLEIIQAIFMSWLVHALPGISDKELQDMAFLVEDISHTRFYKDMAEKFKPIIAKSREEGIEQGRQEGRLEGEISGQIKLLRDLLNDKAISQHDFDRKVRALKQQGFTD